MVGSYDRHCHGVDRQPGFFARHPLPFEVLNLGLHVVGGCIIVDNVIPFIGLSFFFFLYFNYFCLAYTYNGSMHIQLNKGNQKAFSPVAFCVYSTRNHGECKNGDKTAGKEDKSR